MYKFKSQDGLAQSNDSAIIENWNAIGVAQTKDTYRWIEALRKRGIKAAHPDDGWVDRENNEVQLVYPQFNDGVEIGDTIALGWPWDKTRLVTVTDTRVGILSRAIYYKFHEGSNLGLDDPEAKEKA
jgi:hypothetical protein